MPKWTFHHDGCEKCGCRRLKMRHDIPVTLDKTTGIYPTAITMTCMKPGCGHEHRYQFGVGKLTRKLGLIKAEQTLQEAPCES